MAKATGATYDVPFRRRRKGLTNYRKRLALASAGVRMVVRKSLKHVRVQFAEFEEKGDNVLATATSEELGEFGWKLNKNTPTAYLTGLLAGLKAKKKGIAKAVLDVGLHTPSKGALVFAALKGALDAGVDIPHGDGLFDEERLKGAHIAAYASSLKGKPEYEKMFSACLKVGVEPEKIPALFEEAKKKIVSKGV